MPSLFGALQDLSVELSSVALITSDEENKALLEYLDQQAIPVSLEQCNLQRLCLSNYNYGESPEKAID